MNRQQSARQRILRYATILAGSAVLAFGLYNIHARADITEGGVLGAMLLLEHWLHVSPSITSFILDGICYLIGLKILGMGFARYSIAATVGFSVFYRAFEAIGPALPDMSAQPLLAALLGGAFVGAGCGAIVRIGGAAGGDDAIALSVSKSAGWPVARVYIISDMLVLLASLSYIPAGKIAYSVVTVATSSTLIGLIQRRGKPKKQDNARGLQEAAADA